MARTFWTFLSWRRAIRTVDRFFIVSLSWTTMKLLCRFLISSRQPLCTSHCYERSSIYKISMEILASFFPASKSKICQMQKSTPDSRSWKCWHTLTLMWMCKMTRQSTVPCTGVLCMGTLTLWNSCWKREQLAIFQIRMGPIQLI